MSNTMDLMTREPRDWMRRMVRELDRFFDDPALPFVRARRRELEWMPDLELFERDNRLFVRLDLPGLKPEEVSVEARENALIITGERTRETEKTEAAWYRSELTYGRFYRVVPLPDGVKPADVKARFMDGVLEITVPLPLAAAEPPAWKVPVETAKDAKARTAA